MSDEWIDGELWNFVHAAALDLGLVKSANLTPEEKAQEERLHRAMAGAIVAHGIWKSDL